jgi:hypothetical protein
MSSSCPGGVCSVDACNGGWDDCDGLASNGCEHDLGSGSCNALYKRITIDASFVDAALTDFPVLVRISDADLMMSLADGSDLYFTGDGGAGGGPGGALSFAIAAWDQSTGDLTAWVKVPSVSDTTDTVFYLGYGDGIDRSAMNTPTDVWDADFESVQHFDGDIVDATGNLSGTNNGSTDEPAGAIAGARSFNGTSAFIEMGTGVLPNEPGYTLSAWIRPNTTSGGDFRYVMDASDDMAPFDGAALGIQVSDRAVGAYVGGGWRFSSRDFVMNATWAFVAVRYDIQASGSFETSIDGQAFEQVYAGDTRDAQHTSSSRFHVGRWSAGNYFFDGLIDELRVSSTARSDAWIRASYENQRAGSTFLSVTNP